MKINIKNSLFALGFCMLLLSCQNKVSMDMVIHNADIYLPVGETQKYTAIAIQDGIIFDLGMESDIETWSDESTQKIDAQGQFLMPGFIEGHGHFTGLGESMMNLNFLKAKSWDEIVEMVVEKVENSEPGAWISGRGWHQEKWEDTPHDHVHGYPTHYLLSELTKDNPVILRHASGHGLFANAKAMELAGVSNDTPSPSGGEIVRDAQGKAIGVFEERAMNIISALYNEYLNGLSQEQREKQLVQAINLAQEECLSKGVTSFQDAGAKWHELEMFQKLADAGKFDLRLWTMVRHSSEQMKGKIGDYRVVDAGNGFYTCRAIKTEVDGALGSYGAWLLEPYNDKPHFHGQNTTEIEEVETIAKIANQNQMQLCVHAIGDRANREVLDIMEKFVKKGDDKRWRIEHSQHLSVDDIPRFGQLDVIASMQGNHCTSDAPFVVKRLGEQRAKEGAYPWRSLLDSGAVVTNGTDAPVEDVDPLDSFHAAVTRTRNDNGMEFFKEQCMTRREGIDSYTISNAYAAFEEDKKGSIEIGKYADFVILDQNLLSCADQDIMKTQILYTIVDGQIKYQKN